MKWDSSDGCKGFFQHPQINVTYHIKKQNKTKQKQQLMNKTYGHLNRWKQKKLIKFSTQL